MKHQFSFLLAHLAFSVLVSDLAITFSLTSWSSLGTSFPALQSDDIKLFDNQSEYWRTFTVSDDSMLKHGWRNSRILKATSQGLGKLAGSLTYFSGHRDTKEV